jgi:hypothetical protein
MLVIFRRFVAARGGYMRQFPAARWLAALISLGSLVGISGCGGAAKVGTPVAASLILTPSTLSLNEGQVGNISVTALDFNGSVIAVDLTFSSSNAAQASVSSAGAVCGGQFDSNNIVCSPTGDGQATITVTSGSASAMATVYVHKQVDRVVVNPISGCESAGTLLNPSASAYNTTAPGCSSNAPCDITSTVGPVSFGSGNLDVVANAAGIESNYSSATNSPTYVSGGSITGSKDQTCNLSNFSVGGGTGIDPTYNPAKNSPTYVSGGSITGSSGQTCSLSNFNGITGATALVTLSDTNIISSGTHLTITSPGFGGGSTPPTTATLGNGTATCSGTANVLTSLLTTTGVNPVVDAMATVTLTATNTIAQGTHLNVTNEGFGAVQAPTTATLSDGTATCSGTARVITALNSSTGLEAQTPGSTVLFASVSGVNSVGSPFTTCAVQSINVHDANSSATNFSLTGGQAQNLVADVLDSKGQSIKPNLVWATSQPAAIGLSSQAATAAIAGAGPGASTVTATCVTPNCNIGLPPQYSSNVVTARVAGQSPDTVFAASTKSLTMAPIDVVTGAVGTAITLPSLPNSILATPDGSKVYLGADSGGVMVFSRAASSITRLKFNGKLLALTADGAYLVVYDKSVNGTYFYSVASNVILQTAYGTGAAATVTPDNQWGLSLIDQQLARQGNGVAQNTTNLGYAPNAIDVLAQGSLTFITSSSTHAVDVRSTCDQSDLQTLSANNPTLVKGVPNGTGAVVVDSPQIDVITTPQPTGTCPISAANILNGYDLQAGTFTPTQLIVSYDSTRAWILSNLTSVLTFDLSSLTPKSISLAGGAQPLSAGLTLDSQDLYVGASDGNVHLIPVSSLSDTKQFAPGLKDSNSNLVAPDLIAVLP